MHVDYNCECEVMAIEDDKGHWVEYSEHLKAIETLEYTLRAILEEQEILKEERNYYQDKYYELYEQSLE